MGELTVVDFSKVNTKYDEEQKPIGLYVRASHLKKIFLDTSDSTFINWAKAGLITPIKILGGVYYNWDEIQNLIENSKVHHIV